MLAASVYNAFVLVPLYIGMTYKTDIHIHGCVSKILYRNINNHLQRILCDFSDELSRINITVDGFKEEDADPSIIGTGFSCGIDSLSAVYNRYVLETDPEYRINGLFFYSSGVHGNFGDDRAVRLYAKRHASVQQAADKLGLPLYMIDTNIHAFTKGHGWYGPRAQYLGFYSCILALERGIRMYYIPGNFGYGLTMEWSFRVAREIDFAEFAEYYTLPMIHTGNIRLIPEGGQFNRTEKTEQLADWDIAREHLDVCNDVEGLYDTYDICPNCGHCHKCLPTLLALEAVGKLGHFARKFDLGKYKRESRKYKYLLVLNKELDGFLMDSYRFCKAHGMKLPSVFAALLYVLFRKPKTFVRYMMQKVLPEKTFLRIYRRRRYNVK
ncbi:MAG: hypothetical protein IJR63_03900 [Synergistaceae bacterium]|nr:hypothetical protein [Synergistaceae bacterium]